MVIKLTKQVMALGKKLRTELNKEYIGGEAAQGAYDDASKSVQQGLDKVFGGKK